VVVKATKFSKYKDEEKAFRLKRFSKFFVSTGRNSNPLFEEAKSKVRPDTWKQVKDVEDMQFKTVGHI